MHLWPRHYKLILAHPNFQSILFIIPLTGIRDQSRSSCRQKNYNNLYVGGTTLKELRFHIGIIQATYRDMKENSGRNSQQCQWHRTRVTAEIWHLAPNVHKALSDARPSSPTNSPPKRHFVTHQCPFSFSFSRPRWRIYCASCMIKAASASRHGGGGGGGGAEEDDGDVPSSVEEVEMGLLANDEHASSSRESFADADGDGSDDLEGEDVGVRLAAAVRRGGYDGFHGDGLAGEAAMKAPLTREDKKAMALLIVLCASFVVSGVSPPPVLSSSLISSPPPNAALLHHSARLFLPFRYHPGRPGEFLFFRTYTSSSCARVLA